MRDDSGDRQKNYTVLIAHPDDEILFMWPVLYRAKRIICASSDENNPVRGWCRERKSCLEKIGRLIGAEVICLDYDSEFYRLDVRSGQLKNFMNKIMDFLDEPLFTHNAHGEYGNIDHILCNRAAKLAGIKPNTTDISVETDWMPIRSGLKYNNRRTFPPELFNELSSVYKKKNCWTWSFPPVLECGIKTT